VSTSALDIAAIAGHLAVAVDSHCKWAQRAGVSVPEGLPELQALCTTLARSRQESTTVAVLRDLRDAADVPPRLLTRASAARVLASSVRTVDRLVAAGMLPAVQLGSAGVRIRVADLDALVESLPATNDRRAG